MRDTRITRKVGVGGGRAREPSYDLEAYAARIEPRSGEKCGTRVVLSVQKYFAREKTRERPFFLTAFVFRRARAFRRQTS